MQKFQFRLEALLNYRKMQTNQAQTEHGVAEVKWQQALTVLTALRDEKVKHELFVRESKTKPIAIESLLLFDAYQNKLVNKIADQEKATRIANEYRNTCRQRLSDALKRQKLVERLREKRWAQYTQDGLRQEQLELDEIGLQLYVRGE